MSCCLAVVISTSTKSTNSSTETPEGNVSLIKIIHVHIFVDKTECYYTVGPRALFKVTLSLVQVSEFYHFVISGS